MTAKIPESQNKHPSTSNSKKHQEIPARDLDKVTGGAKSGGGTTKPKGITEDPCAGGP